MNVRVDDVHARKLLFAISFSLGQRDELVGGHRPIDATRLAAPTAKNTRMRGG